MQQKIILAEVQGRMVSVSSFCSMESANQTHKQWLASKLKK